MSKVFIAIFLSALMVALIYFGGKWVYEKSQPTVTEIELQKEIKRQVERNPADLWCDTHICKP